MSDNPTLTGQTPKPKKNAKRSSENSKPSEQSLTNSNTPQRPHQRDARQAPRTETDKRADVAALLRGEQSDTTDETPPPAVDRTQLGKADAGGSDAAAGGLDGGLLGEGGDGGTGISPNSAGVGELPDTFDPKFLAEQLGIKPEELYDRLQITTQEGDTITFGEWKDRTTSQVAATREQITREQDLDRREATMTETLHVLNTVGEEVQKHFPQAAEKLAEYNRKVQATERRLAMTAMPELADKAYREQFRDNIAEFLKPYGFRASQLNIMDHRILLALKDAMKTKKQLDKLLSFDPEANPAPPQAQRPQGKRRRASQSQKLVETAQQPGSSRSDKVAAVSSLIRKQ